MLAVVFVRDGVLPSGGDEAIAECGGRVLLCGTGTADAAATLDATEVRSVETGRFAAGSLAERLAPLIDDDAVVLPADPDGRDLAPRLAHRLGRPLHAPAILITSSSISVVRAGGRELHDVTIDRPFVATLVPGVRGTETISRSPIVSTIGPRVDAGSVDFEPLDIDVLEVLEPDLATMDLAEAPRILGGGAGLDDASRFETLTQLGDVFGASVGGTRVITDRGWLPHSRQIGTTGAVVHPSLYLAFGISGAVQHTTGLGDPDHIISVNTDPHCPMMQMADLAIVADANLVLDCLLERAEAIGDHRG
jgi:electron transfer flavoprotein alpha subunit